MRKRLEAWVNEYPNGLDALETREEAHRRASRRAWNPAKRVAVHLVEYDPLREAVVRAAVKWSRRRLPFDMDALDEAVERMQKGRRK